MSVTSPTSKTPCPFRLYNVLTEGPQEETKCKLLQQVALSTIKKKCGFNFLWLIHFSERYPRAIWLNNESPSYKWICLRRVQINMGRRRDCKLMPFCKYCAVFLQAPPVGAGPGLIWITAHLFFRAYINGAGPNYESVPNKGRGTYVRYLFLQTAGAGGAREGKVDTEDHSPQ